ncbi:MAG: segregation/condensation protein A [Rariglobus sp.]
MVPDADYRIKLPVFEGPLDLLLFLIKKNEIDIYDIPIVSVTRQYIEVLHSLKQLDLDIAGEFFVMAATLMEIKSRMLLPRGQAAVDPNSTEEEMDPRWELVHQLLQYKKFKEAAAKLDELAIFQRDLLARHVSELAVAESERSLKNVDRIELWNAFNIVLRRLAEKLVVGQIQDEQVTVSDKMEEVLEFIRTRKTFVFTELFGDQQVTVRLLVATFIAVLELTRLGKLRVRQNDAFTDIECSAREDAALPAAALPGQGDATIAPAAEPSDLTLEASSETEGARTRFAAVPQVLSASSTEPIAPELEDDADGDVISPASNAETNREVETHAEAQSDDQITSEDSPASEQQKTSAREESTEASADVVSTDAPENETAADIPDAPDASPKTLADAPEIVSEPERAPENDTKADVFNDASPAPSTSAAETEPNREKPLETPPEARTVNQ